MAILAEGYDVPSILIGGVVCLAGAAFAVRGVPMGVKRVEGGIKVLNLEYTKFVPRGSSVRQDTYHRGVSPSYSPPR